VSPPPLRRPLTAESHWLPRDGEPTCLLEWLSQWTLRLLAFVPVYVVAVLILTFMVDWFGWFK
jgi:hypothetical protein